MPSRLAAGSLVRVFILLIASFAVGCSSESDQPRSVLDSLAEVEEAKKDFAETLPVTPPADAASTDPSTATPSSDPDAPKTGSYQVRFETSAGDFVVLVHRDWAPLGAKRFHDLVTQGFYDDCRFFRVVSGFMVQFGINGNPAVQEKWEQRIPDDSATQSNKRGYMTFATSGPNSRTTQVFINFVNNSFLDSQGFAPFAEVTEGMDVVDNIHSGYGETPDQGQINSRGNSYLKNSFPELDYVKKVTILNETK